jgi:hypothetical protein
MMLDPTILGRLASDPALAADFAALCDCGGRLAGTESERRALALLKERGADATGRPATVIPVRYGGWRATSSRLELLSERGIGTPCHPLVRTRATDGALEAEVVDLGRGTQEQFAAHAAEIGGRIALVRHEYMFAAGTLHRRRKYEMAREHGAVGFLIAAPLPGGTLVAGSSGREAGEGIPAAGIGLETAARLAPDRNGRKRVRLRIDTEEASAETATLVFDIPGRTDGTVVLSAHLDGHDLAESAMDNATGAAVALAVARALAPAVGSFRRGLRLAFFSVEEWALTGSRHYVEALSPAERARIALDVNLDSVGGNPRLAALTSGFPGLDPFLRDVAGGLGRELLLYRPLMTNSDHANFAAAGIPALRLVAGFDEPLSNLRYVLTPADTRDKVDPGELQAAALLTAAIVAAACQAPDETVAGFRVR